MKCFATPPGVAGVTALAAAGQAPARCSGTPGANAQSCSGRQAGATSEALAGSASPGVGGAWTLPGGDLHNTRDVASTIASSNVGKLGAAWYVPIESTGLARSAGVDEERAAAVLLVGAAGADLPSQHGRPGGPEVPLRHLPRLRRPTPVVRRAPSGRMGTRRAHQHLPHGLALPPPPPRHPPARLAARRHPGSVVLLDHPGRETVLVPTPRPPTRSG